MSRIPLIILCLAAALFCQETIEVVKTAGPSEVFQVSNISKITFTGSDMVVAGPGRTIPLNTIAVLLFHPFPVGVESADNVTAVNATLTPNPFNPAAQLKFNLVRDGQVDVAVYDAAGKRVRTLLAGKQAAGPYTRQWDGRDDTGRPVGSGVYHVMLNLNGRSLIKRAVLVR